MRLKNMKTHVEKLLIGKDGWPVEFIKGKSFVNFLRRIIHGRYYVCRNCWFDEQAKRPAQNDTGGAYSPHSL